MTLVSSCPRSPVIIFHCFRVPLWPCFSISLFRYDYVPACPCNYVPLCLYSTVTVISSCLWFTVTLSHSVCVPPWPWSIVCAFHSDFVSPLVCSTVAMFRRFCVSLWLFFLQCLCPFMTVSPCLCFTVTIFIYVPLCLCFVVTMFHRFRVSSWFFHRVCIPLWLCSIVSVFCSDYNLLCRRSTVTMFHFECVQRWPCFTCLSSTVIMFHRASVPLWFCFNVHMNLCDYLASSPVFNSEYGSTCLGAVMSLSPVPLSLYSSMTMLVYYDQRWHCFTLCSTVTMFHGISVPLWPRFGVSSYPDCDSPLIRNILWKFTIRFLLSSVCLLLPFWSTVVYQFQRPWHRQTDRIQSQTLWSFFLQFM